MAVDRRSLDPDISTKITHGGICKAVLGKALQRCCEQAGAGVRTGYAKVARCIRFFRTDDPVAKAV